MKHQNNGACEKCLQIFDKYPGFNQRLKTWFRLLQDRRPEVHISCAGRGSIDQAAALAAKRSRCKYGESAHNFNCAIDIFVSLPNKGIYDEEWFKTVMPNEIPESLEWYGAVDATYYELPHIELRGWKKLKADGTLTLVEVPHAKRF